MARSAGSWLFWFIGGVVVKTLMVNYARRRLEDQGILSHQECCPCPAQDAEGFEAANQPQGLGWLGQTAYETVDLPEPPGPVPKITQVKSAPGMVRGTFLPVASMPVTQGLIQQHAQIKEIRERVKQIGQLEKEKTEAFQKLKRQVESDIEKRTYAAEANVRFYRDLQQNLKLELENAIQRNDANRRATFENKLYDAQAAAAQSKDRSEKQINRSKLELKDALRDLNRVYDEAASLRRVARDAESKLVAQVQAMEQQVPWLVAQELE